MLTYLPDDSDRCRVKELMASARPDLQPKTSDPVVPDQPKPPRLDYGTPRRQESLQT